MTNRGSAIGTEQQARATGGEAFASLAEMQDTHRVLLKEGRKHLSDPGVQARVLDFLAKGKQTGAILDVPTDRSTAQSLLDYWTSMLYSVPTFHRDTSDCAETLESGGSLLSPFDEDSVKRVADAAEAAVASLSSQDLDIARRILMRLVRLPAEGKQFEIVGVDPESFSSVGDPGRVAHVLDALETSHAIHRVTGPNTAAAQIALRYASLTRSWPRLATWLDQRARYRDAAQFWEQTGRDRYALLGGPLLQNALEYQDLSAIENDFTQSSKRIDEERRKLDLARERDKIRNLWRVIVGMSVVVVCLAFSLWAFRQKRLGDEQKNLATRLSQSVTNLIDDLSIRNINPDKAYKFSEELKGIKQSGVLDSGIAPIVDELGKKLSATFGGKLGTLHRLGQLNPPINLKPEDILLLGSFQLNAVGPKQGLAREKIVKVIRAMEADVLALQEVNEPEALSSMIRELAPEFGVISNQGRATGPTMALMILYRKDRVQVMGDPLAIPGDFARPPLIQRFRIKQKEFVIANVHLRSSRSVERRAEEITRLADWIRDLDPDLPLLVTGGFQTPLQSEELKPLRDLGVYFATQELAPDVQTFTPNRPTSRAEPFANFALSLRAKELYVQQSCHVYELPKVLPNWSVKEIRENISDHNPMTIVLRAE